MANPRVRITPKDASPKERRIEAVASIVVPVQGSDAELAAQEWAVQMAAALGCGLRAIHVRPAAEKAPAQIFEYLERLCRARGVEFEPAFLTGTDAAREIAADVTPTDVIVIGTRRLATKYHLGSVAERLIRSAPCPVQIIRV